MREGFAGKEHEVGHDIKSDKKKYNGGRGCPKRNQIVSLPLMNVCIDIQEYYCRCVHIVATLFSYFHHYLTE